MTIKNRLAQSLCVYNDRIDNDIYEYCQQGQKKKTVFKCHVLLCV